MSHSIPTPAGPDANAGDDRIRGDGQPRGLSAAELSRTTAALAELEAVCRDLDGRPDALLALLRSLEQLHRSIQDGPFRASLPADRNALFQLLSEMERSGGWPYIPRLQLRTFLDLLGHEATGETLTAPGQQHEDPETSRGDSPRLAA